MVNRIPDRGLRQRDVVLPDRLAEVRATVIGVGAIGRQVALQLAAIGVPSIQLIDFDLVEPVNLASQGYFEEDLGRPKVEATADLCRRINSGIQITAEVGRFRRSNAIGNAVFCCVDSIATRRFIWESVGVDANLFVDGRMAAESLRVLVACDSASRAHYPTTLFDPADAYAGACTSKSTIYCANVAAGLMVGALAKYLRRLHVDPDVHFNLLAMECTVADTPKP